MYVYATPMIMEANQEASNENDSMNGGVNMTQFADHRNEDTELLDANESEVPRKSNNDITLEKTYVEDYPDFPPMSSIAGKRPGSKVYIWAGYVYNRDGFSCTFRCSQRTMYDCPGRAKITNGEVKETKPHTHPREPHILRVEQIKQQMINLALKDRKICLTSIYLDACKAEPLVRTHIGFNVMLKRMQNARDGKLHGHAKQKAKALRILDTNLDWTKGWLEIPKGQDQIASCKLCERDIIIPTAVNVRKHYLSDMHKRKVLGLHSLSSKRLSPSPKEQLTEQYSKQRKMNSTNNEFRELDEELEDYAIQVFEEYQEKFEQCVETPGTHKKKVYNNYSSFYEEGVELQSRPQRKDYENNEDQDNATATISTHVWDPNTGQQISGLQIALHKQKHGLWTFVSGTATDKNGNCPDLLHGEKLTAGLHKLKFDTRSYYSRRKKKHSFPYIEIVFDIEDVNELYHFPVQLSPFGYTTSRLTKL